MPDWVVIALQVLKRCKITNREGMPNRIIPYCNKFHKIIKVTYVWLEVKVKIKRHKNASTLYNSSTFLQIIETDN